MATFDHMYSCASATRFTNKLERMTIIRLISGRVTKIITASGISDRANPTSSRFALRGNGISAIHTGLIGLSPRYPSFPSP
jgi:hypothetical protein